MKKKSSKKISRGKKSQWVADFETCEWLENETYVWLWAVCNIETEETEWGTDIESFMEWCKVMGNIDVYFHNLKFDGEFILYYLLKNDFQYVDRAKNNKEFSSLISDRGQFFSIDVRFSKKQKVKFIDSYKLINMPVEEIPKTFGLDIFKLNLDYKKYRPRGYIPNEKELNYMLNDVKIPARALKIMFSQGLTKMTEASNALFDFKNLIGKKTFKHFFPELPTKIDHSIRRAYKGGFTYLTPEYKGKSVTNGIVIDVNSLYPDVMYYKYLPIGYPKPFKGQYQDDEWFDLYIQQITCSFELKPNKIPTIQIRGDADFSPTEYLEHSKGKILSLVLTNIDLKLFFENYKVFNLRYVGGWKFRSCRGLFDTYIEKWFKAKNESKDNAGLYKIAKIMLNALYGKFGLNPICASKIPYLEDDIVKYHTTSEKERKPIYIPVAVFITSYAREKTIRTAQQIYDHSMDKYGENKYIYSDTDSIHTLLSERELKLICDIDSERLGAWKIENIFTKGKFLRQKAYIEEYLDKKDKTKIKTKICCAGLPSRCYDQVSFDNFNVGLHVLGKLTYKHVKGGVKLIDTTFEIKERGYLANFF